MSNLLSLSRKYILLSILILVYLISNAQDTLDVEKIEKGVDKYMSYFSGEQPGAVVTVIKKGEMIFTKAYGLANIENNELMKYDKLFNLGELSKSFTALAILKLVEKNKIGLDNNIKDIFPGFPDYGKNITIRNILDHKSGLANFNPDEVGSNMEVFNFLKKQDGPLFEPGSKFVYSNSDYPLLVSIIEKVSNISYQEFVRKYVLKKLDMSSTCFIDEIENKNIASAHFKENDTYAIHNNEFHGIYGEQGIFTNAADYAKYDKALYTDKILKCENLKNIFRVGKLMNKENVSDYSCGWVLMAKGGIRYFWQGGIGNGYTNLVLHLPDTQTTVLILTNRNDGYDFLKMAIHIAKLFDKQLML